VTGVLSAVVMECILGTLRGMGDERGCWWNRMKGGGVDDILYDDGFRVKKAGMMMKKGSGGGNRYRRNGGGNSLCVGRNGWESIGFAHLGVILELANGTFLPFTSFGSILGGAIMGLSCGMFLFAPIRCDVDHGGGYVNGDYDEITSVSTAPFSDLESAFSDPAVVIHTPPNNGQGCNRKRYGAYGDNLPPPPPSSSSKGADTPIMRRSILTSPEEEEDYDYDFGGVTGNQPPRMLNASYFHRDASSPISTPSKRSRDEGRAGAVVGVLQIAGVCLGLATLVLPALWVGVILEPPSSLATSDGYYGCKTMSGMMYEYADGGDNGGDNDDAYVMSENNAACGEVCIPVGSIQKFLQEYGDSDMDGNISCVDRGYGCSVTNDSLGVDGNFEVVREVYRSFSSDGTSCNSF